MTPRGTAGSRRTADLHGILAAVVTPLTPDADSVDEPVLRAHADRLVAAGVHGFVTTGSTGEFSTLTPQEYRRVVEAYVEAADRRVPVVAGVGALSTRGAIGLAQHAERVGADAIMLLPPFYGGVDLATLRAFLTAVAESISIPIVYYNIPSATGTRLTASEIAGLAEIPGVDYLKDTSGDAVALTELLVGQADRIQAFNGWDTLAVKGDLGAAREQWKHLWAISDFLESVDYVAGVKAGLELVGHPAGPARPPVQPLPAAERERFARILEAAGQLAAS